MQQKKYFYFSCLLHVCLLSFFIFGFDFNGKMPVLENSNLNKEIVNAMVVDTPPVKTQEIKPPIIQEQPKKIEPEVAKIEKPKPVVKEDKLAILPKKTKIIEKNQLEKQLLADLKKQTDQKKKLKHKQLQEAFEQEIKNLSAKNLQQQLLHEKKRVAGARTQAVQGEVDKYKALVLQAIGQRWILPPNVDKSLKAELLIRVAPGGAVLDVQLSKSSGDDAFDRSARAAVLKASPLPVPEDTAAFDVFRQFVLKMKPENIMGAENWVS